MTAASPNRQPPTSAWSMYRAIVGIATLCAVLVVAVFKGTEARILENQQRFLRQAIAQVLPEAAATDAVSVASDGQLRKTIDVGALPVYLGYDADGRLVGAVVTAQGMGYQDNIKLIYAYSFELDAIVGLKILESKETPGLGDRVETEPHFTANFTKLDATLAQGGDALLRPIVTVDEGQKSEPWQIDGITGATITSEAIGAILNSSANHWVPLLENNVDRFPARSAAEER
ncbi:MAG: FMN-binding protein [Gammaproteobacteria bacterium]|nr:FMN-binding protein [Gammaproteobacteria bacterium]